MASESKSTLTLRVHSPELGYLNVRSQPDGMLVTTVSHGAPVTPLEPEETARAKVGQQGQWLHVRLEDNTEGYVAAWYLKLYEPVPETGEGTSPPAAFQILIDSPAVGYLNVRDRPEGALVTTAEHNSAVASLEPEETARAKVGQQGEWLHVRVADGQEGYVAAWYLKLIETTPETGEDTGPLTEPEPQPPAFQILVDSPAVGYLNVRDRPDGALVTTAVHGSAVASLEPEETARAKVGQQGEWLHVRVADGQEGYIAAWYLKLAEEAETDVDTSQPTPSQPTLQIWVNSPEVGYLNIRRAPSTSGALITQAQHDESLLALEDESSVRAKIGQQGKWLKVRLAGGQEGYGAAPYLALISARPPDTSLEPPPEQKFLVTSTLSGTERKVALTWNRLGGLLQTLADQMGIDPGVAVAVLTVESGGRAFGPDGRMIIRFENHIFHDRWGKHNPDTFAQHFTFNSDQRWKDHQWRPSSGQSWRTFHGNQNNEWKVLDFASTLDDSAARLSISMGGPQIMGFNYAAIGYASVRQMFDAFANSEREQVAGFFNFVRSRGERAIQMLQRSDFNGFASIYNGPGQAATYGSLIQQTYDAYRQVRAASLGVAFGVPTDAAPAPLESLRFPLYPLVEVDDLERILGIGPKTAARLKAEGIDSFEQLAALDVEQLEGLLGDAAARARWVETWPAQARLAAWGDWNTLKVFQAQLK